MDTIPLFPTNIFRKKCNLNLDEIKTECYNHQSQHASSDISNIGGYQGHNFYNNELAKEIHNSLPRRDDKPLKSLKINQWVNINKTGDSNSIHNHDPYNGIALSGVFYVSVPKNCGNIVFYDPRTLITTSLDQKYYSDSNDCFIFQPEENLLLIFPSWLYHSVDPNQSGENRISISFNISLNYKGQDSFV